MNFDQCFTLGNLIKSARVCEKNVRWKRQVQMFMVDVGRNCNSLLRELRSGDYRLSKATEFKICERGKVREIKAVCFRDRVVQRCLCDHYLTPLISSVLIEDNSACQKGKGVTYALERTRNAVFSAPEDSWVVQFDYSSFFKSLDQDMVIEMLGEIIDDDRIYDLLDYIVHSEPEGLNLGNQISQTIAIFYPHKIDERISGRDDVYYYHRYMDDGLVLCDGKDSAKSVLDEIGSMSSDLKLTLNPKKSHINKISQPFVFLKTRFHKKRNRVKMNVRKQQVRRMRRHLRKVRNHVPEIENMDNIRASCIGYINRCDADLTHIVDGELC